MKYVIASDIHGSAYWCERLLETVENEGADGLCKILVDKKRRTVLGVHLIGSYSGEINWGAAEMIEMHLRVTDARQIIFPHPTVSEIIRETLWEFPD